MAVVQISRIQIRRGRKNQGSGLPQLASGEFGWAVDAQELYIGNGSVSEGAPFVGNTQILTENDNLFEYAKTYSYKSPLGYLQTGSTTTGDVVRTLQDRLDDRVSVRGFGANGDGSMQTTSLQRAIDQLFINPFNVGSESSRVILHLEPGVYFIDDTLTIPPYTTIVGAGSDKTVIRYTGSGSAFRTVNGLSTPGNPANESSTTYSNQCRNIRIDGLTLVLEDSNSVGFELQSLRDSSFNDLRISGNRNLGDNIVFGNFAFSINSLGQASQALPSVTTHNNYFSNVKIQNISYAIYSDDDSYGNVWDSCRFITLGYGIVFGANSVIGTKGQTTGPFDNTIKNSYFDDIEKQGFLVVNGTGNQSKSNKYYKVGNDGAEATPVEPVIQFDSEVNYSIEDWFLRDELLGNNESYFRNTAFIPTVAANTIYKNAYTFKTTISQATDASDPPIIINLPGNVGRAFEIDYVYKSLQTNSVRQGKLKLTINSLFDTPVVVDEYDFSGPGDPEALQFNASLQKLDINSPTSVDTLSVTMLNSTTNDNAEFYYTVTTK